MPRDATGNIIPGSYNPDGSINQAAMQQYQQRALQNPGAAIRSPVATARLMPTNASPNAAQVIAARQQMAQRAAQAAAAQAAGGATRQPLRTGAIGTSLRGDVNQATVRPDMMSQQAQPTLQPPVLKQRQAGLRPPMGLGTAITR